MRRVVEMVVGAAALLLFAGTGYSAGSRDSHACVAAYKSAVKAEQASHLRDAQKSFAACAKATCNALVRRECLLRYDQLAQDIPSVVPVVTDATGDPMLDVKITMDGETLATKIDGRAVPVDPGLHEFSFVTPGGTSTQKIVILQGQRNRPISIALGANGAPSTAARPVTTPKPVASAEPEIPEPAVRPSPRRASAEDLVSDEPPPPSSRSARSIAPYLLTGLGLVAVGGYAAMTYWGRKDNDMLVKCAPNCMQTSVDHVKKLYLGANISLGVGVAALGAATWLFLKSGGSKRLDVEAASSGSRYAVDVVPVPAGAVASVRGGF